MVQLKTFIFRKPVAISSKIQIYFSNFTSIDEVVCNHRLLPDLCISVRGDFVRFLWIAYSSSSPCSESSVEETLKHTTPGKKKRSVAVSYFITEKKLVTNVNESYRVIHKGWDFRDDCTESIYFVNCTLELHTCFQLCKPDHLIYPLKLNWEHK